MSDLIKREDAINEIREVYEREFPTASGAFDEFVVSIIPNILRNLPPAEPESEVFEWCHDCKEYDQKNHCCHRWTKVIRQTIADVKQQYALEHPNIVHCNECFYGESADDKEDGYRCRHAMNAYRSAIWFGGDFCSYGEKNDE